MRTSLRSLLVLTGLLCLTGCFALTRGVHAMGRSHEILDPIHLFRDDEGGRYAVVLNADYISQSDGTLDESATKVLFVADAAVREGSVAFDPAADPVAGVALVPEGYGDGLSDEELKRTLLGFRELLQRRHEDGAFLDERRNLALRIRIASGEDHRREHNAWWAWCATPLYVPAVVIDVICLPVQAVMDDSTPP